MKVLHTVAEFRQARAAFDVLGFVPTMGYLHQGHLALVEQARRECPAVAVSIFVNPTQFGPNEDYARYPRDTNRDLALLEAAGVDLVFIPSVEEMYPPGFGTYVIQPAADEVLEGAARPGHFRGVATVVCKLFNIVQPTKSYFGQKDAQQTVVVRQMVRDLNLPVEIVIVPTVREPDGLALSSRNVYLNAEQRAAAPVLYRALRTAAERYAAGERDAETLRAVMRSVLAGEPLARPDYVSVAHPLTLRELDRIGADGALLSMAVRFDQVRLIDNWLLEGEGK
ncbi:MAG TPA: pantoate--beta-alanine ligase [Chloroflexus aurantiacus]|jgi:pantoate--beta-alanine ligase|uniref:Pantothenate synthetase n=2 Tax=Chloroflexus aurantiacus TaxID=1108 RepID=PANC_CHLAA|nr:pantoate--beta-alanine ligase [Chloroflexus aurantiacus]A9WFR6.1 RecName: Full=Pantothenate synthetase; Short=PS; AltName: Full=Pantoate--beta-alanine ligase; AltName: Full=Pantoate-activating enzyme [Chloroflexus aurantiacus J-10-fl]B9LIH9.1 RecName: Full=Pantothenate synthetase; Short=PS; AltName: Full=Pantoate--beta-alanine ligase; AltName: Full=Pantoate-activating enzyme [Chloroflexus aurantiacus Y-400-fl]RMG49856.1 MAG: pantoate--beta-alanine ligase [Chloroflexota bacterium]GIV92150.1 M